DPARDQLDVSGPRTGGRPQSGLRRHDRSRSGPAARRRRGQRQHPRLDRRSLLDPEVNPMAGIPRSWRPGRRLAGAALAGAIAALIAALLVALWVAGQRFPTTGSSVTD